MPGHGVRASMPRGTCSATCGSPRGGSAPRHAPAHGRPPRARTASHCPPRLRAGTARARAQRARRRAAREQVFVFLQVAGEHRELLALALRELFELLQPVGPGRFRTQVIDHHHARMLQHFVDVQVERRRLAQVHQVGQPQRRVAGVGTARPCAPRRAARAWCRPSSSTTMSPGVWSSRVTTLVVFDEAAGLGAQQVHAVRPSGSGRAHLFQRLAQRHLRRGLRR